MNKYYDHNKIWSRRLDHNHPVWGSYSVILYKRILALLDEHEIKSGRMIDYGCGAGKFGELALADAVPRDAPWATAERLLAETITLQLNEATQ